MISNRIVSFDGGNEVARNELGTLVDQLVEGVLAVRARLAPEDGAGRHIDGLTVAVDALAIALHVALLEVGSKAVHVLVIGKNRVRLGPEEIVVPDTQ